jgi:hypothetical protein
MMTWLFASSENTARLSLHSEDNGHLSRANGKYCNNGHVLFNEDTEC